MLKNLFIIIFLTLVISCIVTPVIFSLILHFFPGFVYPYARVFDRTVLLTLIIMVLVFRKKLSLSELKPFFDLSDKKKIFAHYAFGMTITLFTAMLALPFMVQRGLLEWHIPTFDSVAYDIGKILATGLLISLIEESFFRVLMFSGFKKKFPVVYASIFTSIIYGFLHFIAPDRSYVYPGFSPFEGFSYFFIIFSNLVTYDALCGIFGLFLVGNVLCYAFHKTGSIFLSIGLHSGWVMAVKLVPQITDFSKNFGVLQDVIKRNFLVTCYEAWISVLLVGLILYVTLKNKKI